MKVMKLCLKILLNFCKEMARYDIIAGKIADDATNATLTAYLAGAFGTEGDQEAAIECLKFVKGEKIWLK